MREVRRWVHPVEVIAMCLREGCVGRLHPTGQAYATHPMQYPHRCTVCGKIEVLPAIYPRIEYEQADRPPDTPEAH